MSNIQSLGLLSLALLFSACSHKPSLEELQNFAATEQFPEDQFLAQESHKKALIIVAHDDDDCAMSGTIAKLTAAGWTIQQMSFQIHLMPGKTENAASIICAGNLPIVEDGIYRKGLDTMQNPYVPLPYAEIAPQFYQEKITAALIQKVNDFKPSAIFTLDNVKGGYGHPEHIYISQLVLDLFQAGKLDCQRIYQSVFTDHMEREIVDTWLKAKMEKYGYPNPSEIANEMYGIEGMPAPTVQIDIQDQAQTKMAYLRAYPENVKRNLRKFLPYYEDFKAEEYFKIFHHEYFRVIES